ncbi:hypothetical protein [Streptomyces sp. KL116D]|uniref:hypothetical protein n=1 Tax=Streptomyces sp. KL116D TaxID=3045152 RepID=UPI003558AF54
MRVSFRLTFTEFIADPDDEDCRRRAATIPADSITFEGADLILWIGGTERARYPIPTIKSVEVVQAPGGSRREDPDQLRSQYPNFGKPWTALDEEKLLELYRAGQQNYEVLAIEFGRQPTAIRSRLAKLGLEQLAPNNHSA